MRYLRPLLLILAMTLPLLAEPVARVHQILGQKNLSIKKTEAGKWYRAHLEQNADVGHSFKTDAETMANLQFFLGGYASLGKDCEVKIITERDVDIVSQGVKLKKGAFWARFDKQKKAPIRIQTAGGVMGIRGTEFVVQVEEDGSTKLSLLEGEVAVTSAQGQSFTAKPGNEVTFGPGEPLLHRVYKLNELQDRLKADLGPAFMELRNSMRELRTSLRDSELQIRAASIALEKNLLIARTAALVGDDETRRQFEDGGGAKEGLDSARDSLRNLDNLLEQFDSKRDPDPQPPSQPVLTGDPKVAPPLTTTEHPSVSWDMEQGEQYAVLFLDPKDDDKVYWVDETSANAYSHPTDAEPLAPGDYRFWVVPLDAEGEALGEALEGRFRVTS